MQLSRVGNAPAINSLQNNKEINNKQLKIKHPPLNHKDKVSFSSNFGPMDKFIEKITVRNYDELINFLEKNKKAFERTKKGRCIELKQDNKIAQKHLFNKNGSLNRVALCDKDGNEVMSMNFNKKGTCTDFYIFNTLEKEESKVNESSTMLEKIIKFLEAKKTVQKIKKYFESKKVVQKIKKHIESNTVRPMHANGHLNGDEARVSLSHNNEQFYSFDENDGFAINNPKGIKVLVKPDTNKEFVEMQKFLKAIQKDIILID